ncbi:1-phosphatidylinositol 3-phosphate 5-kinase [Amyelois transitella]|uniref:1-phosphatidylinositol 3-phosphate 5-kinase n=1 Tax=Amyelois transitella TaxID=680683 RepID=UPI0029907DC1|nr:1-phosphatidylinositol 3-phosphate 5-kinase [Amyelois transitella]
MDKYDTSQLTEFPRFEPESSQSGVSTFFTKLWKFPKFSPSETSENLQEKVANDEKQEPPQREDQSKSEYDDTKTETGSYAVEFEGRSLPNVLRRISSLIAMGSGGGTRYADTELARYWMPDDISRECYECAARFSTLRRRHHCRVCGQIFCSRCCSQRVPGQIFGCADGLRVCNYCCNIVLSYLRENDMTGEISPDLRVLQENLQVKFPDNKSQSSAGRTRDNFMFAREQDERCEPRAASKETIQDVYRQLSFTLPTQQHRYRLVRYNGVWRGCDILQWVMDNTNNKMRVQATQVCQNLLSSGFIECVSELPSFADYALYRPTVLPPNVNQEQHSPEECNRLVESVSSYCLDLNLDNNSARLIKAPKTEVKTSPTSEEENPVPLPNNEGQSPETSKIDKAIWECGWAHLKLLTRQCIARQGLPASWLPVLYPLCQQAADIIMPDLHSSEMDIRHYVQVKKVCDGVPKDTALVRGLVLTKNVAHRGMPQDISDPTVLLLDCSIAYQRVEGKLTSLEPVLLQEQQYLVRCAARICALRPDVVLVGGSVGRGVQDALRTAGVALATGVPQRALRRAARCTRADLVTSIDARIGTPKLGTATRFYVKNYSSKTLMVLEDCAEPHLGCCIILRGASLAELTRVKKVVKFILLAFYNWKLERAFFGDIGATLPEPGMTFDDDENETDKSSKINDANDIFDGDNDVDETKDSSNDKIDVLSSVDDDDAKMFEGSDDPLMKKSYTRKTDSEKNFNGVPIQDFSDPLHSTMSIDDDVFLAKEEVTLKADDTIDRWSTDDVVLSMSPNVMIPAPFLETEAGKRSPLRAFLPRAPAIPRARPPAPRADPRPLSEPRLPAVVMKEMHPFIKNPISSPADDPANRAALAHYRATGCRIVADAHKMTCPLYKPSVVKKNHKQLEPDSVPLEKQESEPLDPLAPENHQRMSLLLYSYSNKSANVPDFCVNPWIVTMEMYGRHDISLGAFLEKYCFNPDYKCPSTNCQVPMNQHIRRFVHGDVCITISCNTVGHSNVDKVKEDTNKQVRFWSRCQRCGARGRAVALCARALALSLAGYVRLRARAARPRRACAHPLHAHAHAFCAGLTTAVLRYDKISTFDIELPPEVIATRYDTKQMRETLIQQLNDLMHKGHETFSGVSDSEAETDYQTFKQHMEQIHLALTADSLGGHTTQAAVVRSLWSVSDRIITGEKMLRDAQDKWSSPVTKTPKPTVETVEEKEREKSDLEDSAGESVEGTTYMFADNPKEIEKEHTSTGADEDEEKGDKKTVRQILSQLLSNSQPSHQSGIIISGGCVPVVVAGGEIGSVIAATLASVAYQRSLRASAQPECEDVETSTSKEKSDGEKSNKTKSSDHFEVLLKDGLLCRVYYPQQFQKLRHMLIAPLNSNPHIADEFANTGERAAGDKCGCEDGKTETGRVCDIEEGFVRSLSRCVPWAARGGKSGSTFCKTQDDRYVLKEMTKAEWQQFLEFAPHYFNYVINCHQNKLPSLLARILGVYSVGGAGNGVLVMENIWYSCSPNAKRFDLKGSSRHRLTTDTQPLSVLMDENLLNLRWETPLYVQSHVGSVLWSCIERDTAFLAQHEVMDYSLLLGIDKGTLVLGIIDYIRTFTWDKKLEHLVKKNLGSGQPTVLSPADYRRRFSAACRKYFLQCPDHWDSVYAVNNT